METALIVYLFLTAFLVAVRICVFPFIYHDVEYEAPAVAFVTFCRVGWLIYTILLLIYVMGD